MPPAPPGTRPTGPSCPRIHDASTNHPSRPLHCPSALPSEFCIGESLVSTSPEQFRKRYHASKGKPRPWGRYSASTAMRATFSKESLARGTDAVCKRCRIFKGIPSLCKRYNACKVTVSLYKWRHLCESGPRCSTAARCARVRWSANADASTAHSGYSETLRGRKSPIGVGRALAARERREELG